MKYTNINSFKKFLESFEAEKIKLFLVLASSSFERRKYVNNIKKNIKKNFSYYRFFEKVNISKIINTYQSPSFFGSEPFCIIEDIFEYSKNEINDLFNFIKNIDIHLILSSDSKTQISNLYNLIEKKGVIFDLSLEKIWDKQKRFSDHILNKCLKENKNISSNVIEKIFEKVGLDLSNIDNELNKLLVFIKDKKSIELDDLDKILIESNQATIWQAAENMIFSESFEKINLDQSILNMFFSSVRYQLKQSLKIASLIENKEKNIASYFPKIYPRILDKKIEIIKKIDINFFKKALIELFEIDLISKSSNIKEDVLFDILQSKLLHLKAIHRF
jgi:DNA polymerase-3 subunit delta